MTTTTTRGGGGMALRVCTYPSTGWMSSSPPGGTAAFADARDDRGTTIPTLPPSPLPRTTTTTTCGRRDSGCWLALRVAYARYYDAMTIIDDVDDDAMTIADDVDDDARMNRRRRRRTSGR